MKKLYITLASAAVALLLSGCTIDVASPEQTTAFSLNGELILSPEQTRAAQYNSVDVNKLTKIYVKGYNGIAAATGFTNYTEVTASNGEALTDVKWLSPYPRTFYAYANLPSEGASVTSTSAADGQTLTYTVPATAAAQNDIMLATYTGAGINKGAYRYASLDFKHPLTAVRFKIGEITNVASITKISIKGVYTGGSVNQAQSGAIGTWTASGTTTVSQTVSVTTFTKSAFLGGDTAFLLIPQTATSGISLELEVTPTGGQSKTVSCDIPNVDWQAGVTNIYTIDYNGGYALSLDYTVADWGAGQTYSNQDFDEFLPAPTPAPENPVVSSSNSLTFNWNAVPGADKYKATLYKEEQTSTSGTAAVKSAAARTLVSSKEVTTNTVTFDNLDSESSYVCDIVAGKDESGSSDTAYSGNALSVPAETTVIVLPYVEIAGVKWARQNLAISTSGNMKWKGGNSTAVKVPGTDEDVIVGDYFQWAAYAGYCGDPSDPDKGLLVYTSFESTNCVNGGSSDNFVFKSDKGCTFKSAPYSTPFSTKVSEDAGESYTKYFEDPNQVILEKNDDAAYIILGGNWRMPTLKEIKSMHNATVRVADNTDKGYYFFEPTGSYSAGQIYNSFPTGKNKSDALLFIPWAGGYGFYFYAGTQSDYVYWTSSVGSEAEDINSDFKYQTNGACLFPIVDNYFRTTHRFVACSIRPVWVE